MRLTWMLAALAGCYDPLYGVPLDDTSEAAGPAFPADVDAVFQARCGPCHTTGANAPNLAPGYDDVVSQPSTVAGVNLVEPGDPDNSYLYAKLAGTQAAVGGGGSLMPLTGGPLADADLEIVYNWILDGAPAAE